MGNACERVAVFGTFDTKGREFALLRDCIEQNGLKAILIDTGLTQSPYLKGDYVVRELIEQQGHALGEVADASRRAVLVDVISGCAAELIGQMQKTGEISGAISMGGGQGSYIASGILRSLPIGFPKVLLSTIALVPSSAQQFMHLNDTVVLNSLVDIAGINSLLKKTIAEAAGALCGMVRALKACAEEEKLAVAISAWGVTTPCVNRICDYLTEEGIEPLVFHSSGEGGAILEALSRQGKVSAVVDITWSEESIPLAGGALPFVSGRMEGAVEGKIPRVMAPGGVDMILARRKDIEPDGKFFGRTCYQHNPEVLFVRSSVEDNIRFGVEIAKKLNRATAPVKLLLPLGGLSAVDQPGECFYAPETDRALFDSLKTHIENPLVELVELPYHINSSEFADALMGALRALKIGGNGHGAQD